MMVRVMTAVAGRWSFGLILMWLVAAGSVVRLGAGEDPARPMPRNKDYPWMSVHSWQERHGNLLKAKAAGRHDILFIGDSITEGWGGAGRTIWEREFAPMHALNLGIGGDTTQNILWRLANGAVDQLDPRLVVLLIGTNNLGLHDDKPADVVRGIRAVVDDLRRRLPRTRVLLLGIFPRGEKADSVMRRNIRAVNHALAAATGNPMVRFADIGSVFLRDDGTLGKDIMPDHLHLSALGFGRWAEAIRPIIAEMAAGGGRSR